MVARVTGENLPSEQGLKRDLQVIIARLRDTGENLPSEQGLKLHIRSSEDRLEV